MKLLTSGTLGNLELKNRVVMAPLTRARAGVERMPNALMAEYYSQRASAGLIISEATVVSKDGIGWQQSPGIWSSAQAEAWKQVVDAVHAKGGKMFLQLWHCGRASHSAFPERDGRLPAAPSAVRLEGDEIHTPEGKKKHETPRELSLDEIAQTVKDYGNAARLAKLAGFDGIEVHGANGYLIDQFLQSRTNKRTDAYGGNFENRFRFLDEVLAACLDTWSAASVGIRLSPNGAFNDMGSTDYREMFKYTLQQLNKKELAYVHVMDGLAFGFHELGEPVTLAEARECFSGSIIGNCGYDKDSAEKALAEGHADFIAFGRPFISNPDLVERFTNEWPLAEQADMAVWYSFDAEGYTDFPRYAE